MENEQRSALLAGLWQRPRVRRRHGLSEVGPQRSALRSVQEGGTSKGCPSPGGTSPSGENESWGVARLVEGQAGGRVKPELSQ